MSSFTITNLRTELRVHLGNLDATDLPNTDADLLLNRAKWKLEEELDLPQNELHTTFNTIAGTASYAQIFPIDAVIRLALNDTEQEKLVPINIISEDYYNENYKTNAEFQGKPESYFMRGENIILYPTPDDIYSIEITRREILNDVSDSITTLSMSKALQSILLLIATYYGYIRYRDFNAANRINGIIQSEIRTYVNRNVKEEDWHKAQVQLLRNEYKP